MKLSKAGLWLFVGCGYVTASHAQDSGADLPLIPVAADEAPVPAKGDKKATRPAGVNRLVEEVVVTSQKREEAIQDVPISIAAFSGEALEARGVTQPKDLGQITPALQFSEIVGYTLIYLRGIGTDAWLPSADPSIATYVDGVYIPASQGVVQSFGAIERVEILKGPQGTLFGRNSTGGAINIINKRPDNRWAASAEVGLGNYNEQRAKVYLNVPVTDTLAASLSAVFSEVDHQYSDPSLRLPTEETRAIRVKLNWQATDDINLDMTAFRSLQQGAGAYVATNTHPSQLATLAGIAAQKDDYVAYSDYGGYFRGSHNAVYGTLTWTTPILDVKLIGSDQFVLTDDSAYDFDASAKPLFGFESPYQYSDMQTAELQFISNDGSWAADRFKWLAGLYYLQSTAGYDPVHLRVAPNLLLSSLATLGAPVPAGLTNVLQRLQIDGTPLSPGGSAVHIEGLLGTESYSGFFQGTWTFKDWLDLTLGGRYQQETRKLKKANSGIETPNGDVLPLFSFDLKHSEVSNFSPRAVLSTHPADDVMVYLSWAKGFKSATFNVVNIYAPPAELKPEQVTSWELGVKSEFFGGLLRFNAAAFHTEIKDLQVQFISLLAGGAVQLENAPKARIQGAEFDATLVPMPHLNPGLALTANAAYLDATYTDYPSGSGFSESTGIFSSNLDFTDHRIVRSPRWSGSVALVQTIETSDTGEVELATDAYYNSGFYYTAQNLPFGKEQPFIVTNARASYLYKPWNVRVTAYGQNILDERYHMSEFQNDFGNTVTLNYPARYGMRLSWDF